MFVQAGENHISKDPVYELLHKKSTFAERLHEVPLYLMGKSLLKDDAPLYQEATELYKARNKLAHSGTLETAQHLKYRIREADARAAIECVVGIFRWFNIQTQFPSLETQFVEGQGPTE